MPGFTNAPDLLNAANDPGNSRVVYGFDEAVASARAPGFFVTAPSGSSSGTTGSVAGEGNVAKVTFGVSASSSIGAGTTTNAVSDARGNPSPGSSISYELQKGTGQPPTQTTPPSTLPAGFSRYATKVSLKHRRVRGRSSRVQFSGRLSSTGRGCKAGRRVVLRRSGKGTHRYASTLSRGDGTFVLKRKRRVRGKLYAVVSERTNKTTRIQCRTGKSKSLRN